MVSISGLGSITEFLTSKSQTIETFTNSQQQSIETLGQITIDFANSYLQDLQATGFSVSFMEDMLILFVSLRFVVLAIRYNIITSFVLSAISIFASYFWYMMFLQAINAYENALYKNPLTFRLGVDAMEIRTILKSQVDSMDYALRLTNPAGIILHAINKGTLYNYHRIDPFSMIASIIINTWSWAAQRTESGYYFIYRTVGPFVMRLLVSQYHSNSAYLAYSFITRVNKTTCPYLVRWHWTFCLISKFFVPIMFHILYRITYYMDFIIEAKVQEAAKFYLVFPQLQWEKDMLTFAIYTIIIGYLSFILYAMFHAILGQYFYVPFFTENVELHLGPREKDNIYSSGYTAWQDADEKSRSIFLPKLWYGWFGRGTKSPNIIIVIIRRFIYRPIYGLIKRLVKSIRRILKR